MARGMPFIKMTLKEKNMRNKTGSVYYDCESGAMWGYATFCVFTKRNRTEGIWGIRIT